MKRHGNLFESIASLENLQLADKRARKGKADQYGVQIHSKNELENLKSLQEMLLTGSYRTSEYSTFTVFEPKERLVFRLPYFPDRIAHHAIMNILEPIFTRSFTADTYSCIKGRGIHLAARKVQQSLKDVSGTKYCLKMDIQKFYPSVNHEILKSLLRKKFKDERLLQVLDEIIDSAEGLPIGNYLSQYFANFYLTYFDHWIKETQHVKYYFRYADDLVILSDSKQMLHRLCHEIIQYLADHLKLKIKQNYQIFPVESRGIDFLGYVFFHTHVRLRKSIKQNFARMLARNPNTHSIASYYGWAKHCNTHQLLTKLLTDEQIQRLRYKTKHQCIQGGKDQDRTDIEQGNNGEGLRNSTKQLQRGAVDTSN